MWIVEKIKGLFNGFVQIFKGFIAAAIPMAKQVVMGKLAEISDKAVAELDVATITNSEKREEAFKRIRDFAVSRGIQAKDHVIYLLVELAYSKLKEAKESALPK